MRSKNHAHNPITGLYGIADAGASGGDPERMLGWLLEGGCRVIQLRCKGWTDDAVLITARRMVSRCRAAGALLLLNDRAHLVEAVSADGVHVGQGDADSHTVRTLIGPNRILGRSTHNVSQIQQALPAADYIAFGPIFQTSNLSTPKRTQGLNRLRTAVHAVAGRAPLVAIGGISASNIADVRAGGANAWAVIGAIANAADPVEQTTFFVNVT